MTWTDVRDGLPPVKYEDYGRCLVTCQSSDHSPFTRHACVIEAEFHNQTSCWFLEEIANEHIKQEVNPGCAETGELPSVVTTGWLRRTYSDESYCTDTELLPLSESLTISAWMPLPEPYVRVTE